MTSAALLDLPELLLQSDPDSILADSHHFLLLLVFCQFLSSGGGVLDIGDDVPSVLLDRKRIEEVFASVGHLAHQF